MVPPHAEDPAFTQGGWDHPNAPPEISIPSQGDVDFTLPSISTGPVLPSKSVIPPRLYSCTTPWDPVVASIPFQARFPYDTPTNHPHAQSHVQLHGLEKENSSRYSRNYIAPSEPSGHSPQPGRAIYGPGQQATFPPPYTNTPQAPVAVEGSSSMGVIGDFDYAQQPQAPGSTNPNPNRVQYQYRGRAMVDVVDGKQVVSHGDRVDSSFFEVQDRSVKPRTVRQIGSWDQVQETSHPSREQCYPGPNTMVNLPPNGVRSSSFPDFNAQMGGTRGSSVHEGSESQRAQSVESFFFKQKQPSQPPPIIAPRWASTTIIDTPLKKSLQGVNSRFEQSSAYPMLWPPSNIQAEPGDLFVNTDSVTSGSRTWISDGATWTPIAHTRIRASPH